MRKNPPSQVPYLNFLSKREKTVVLACLLFRSRSYLLFSLYLLLGDAFFLFLHEFAGKRVKIPPREIIMKYYLYSKVYSMGKDKDLNDLKTQLGIAKFCGIRRHQIGPIYKKVDREIKSLESFLQKELSL